MTGSASPAGAVTGFRRGLSALRIALRDAYGLLLVALFRLLATASRGMRTSRPRAYETSNALLIRSLNFLAFPWRGEIRAVRNASRDLETYWRTYDALGLDLYALALQEPEWFRGRRILDVGCGVGRKSYELARRGADRVVGVDASSRTIEVARRMAGAVGNLEFHAVETVRLGKEYEGSFDYVVSFTVFEHVTDVEGALRDLERFLKPGGRNVIVFNHYDDRFGSHLKEFILHPWPQIVFDEELLFRYWNRSLAQAHARGELGYFPPGYVHGLSGDSSGCFMNLNRCSVEQFESIVARTAFTLERELFYSASPLLAWLPWLGSTRLKKNLRGSVAYVLRRSGESAGRSGGPVP